MSRAATRWAWAQSIDGRAKIVLLCIADHADDAGLAWPSVTRLVGICCMSERSVQRAIIDLIGAGLMTKTGVNGTLPRFQLMVQTPVNSAGVDPRHICGGTPVNLAPVPVLHDVHQSSTDPRQVGTPVPSDDLSTPAKLAPEPSKKERIEGDLRSPHAHASARTCEQAGAHARTRGEHPDFAAWWAAYPRKVGKGAARKAYASAIGRGADPVEVLSAIGQQRWSPEVQFRPHASTWLNADRWLDDPEAAAPLPTPPGPSAAMLRIQQRDHDLLIIAGRIPGNDDDLFIPNMQTRFLQ